MSALDRKLLRDIWRMKGQAAAIAVLIALATGNLIGSASTHRALKTSRDTYYAEYRFADVFANLSRAPLAIADRLRAIPGVDRVEARLVATASLRIAGFGEPISATVISLPAGGQPDLDRLHLRRGRLPDFSSSQEAVVSEAFAVAQKLRPGDRLTGLLNGRKLDLSISGVALSPEYVYEVQPGALMPDPSRFAVLWLPAPVIEAALGIEGAFNDALLKLARGASEDEVITRVDAVLAPYGGLGAFGRDRHMSARFIAEELDQLETTAFFVPSIFLGVAAFLLNLIIGRIVATEREQIATLKALGYANRVIGLHYLKLALLIVCVGTAAGSGLGYVIGQLMTISYSEYYRFPRFIYRLSGSEVVISAAISLGAALIGTLGAVRRAVILHPAEAMRPAAPATYRKALPERIGFDRLLSTAGRVVLRNLWRRPLRAMASCLGIAFAVSLLVTGLFFADAVDEVVTLQFRRAQRQSMGVSFTHGLPGAAAQEIGRLPGVLAVEPARAVVATLRHGHRDYRTPIIGLKPGGRQRRILATGGKAIDVPKSGLLISQTLADNLDVKEGDAVRVEPLEGLRRPKDISVAAIVDEPFGVSAYASIDTANLLAGTGPEISGVNLLVDPLYQDKLFERLREIPTIAGVSLRKALIDSFTKVTDKVLLFFASILSIFAGAMAVGVVYNAARISISERERELATMRVIGMTRMEISSILLGELGVLVTAALPLGCAIGRFFVKLTADSAATDMYRIPIVVRPSTYAFAIIVVTVASVAVALITRRRLDRLDLVSVLKTQE